MIWGILTSAGLAGLFLFLFIRSVITNGKLKGRIVELEGIVDVQNKQLEIASKPNRSDADIADRMRKGDL